MHLDHRSVQMLVIALAIAGLALVIIATPFGAGIYSDSIVYIETGRNLLSGEGLVFYNGITGKLSPMTHYPPVYPSLLAFMGLVGITLESAALWLNALLIGCNIMLVAWIIRTLKPENIFLPLFGALLTLSASDVIAAHTVVMTEPLYIFFMLLSTLFLVRYDKSPYVAFVAAAGIMAALAVMTRYVGASLVIGGGLLIFLKRSSDIKQRFTHSAVFGVAAVLPLLLWMMRNAALSGGGTDRRIVFHPVTATQLLGGVGTVTKWLLGGKMPAKGFAIAIAFVVLIGCICLLLTFLRKRRAFKYDGVRVPLFLIASFVGFLIFTASFIDIDTVFDSRALVPIHILVIIVAVYVIGDLVGTRVEGNAAKVSLACIALILVVHVVRTAEWVSEVRVDGQFYAARSWRGSPTVAKINLVDQGVPLYSNLYDVPYYFTRRYVKYIPRKIDRNSGFANPSFESEMERMKNDIVDRGGQLIYFTTPWTNDAIPDETEINSRMKLVRVASENDGTIYAFDPR